MLYRHAKCTPTTGPLHSGSLCLRGPLAISRIHFLTSAALSSTRPLVSALSKAALSFLPSLSFTPYIVLRNIYHHVIYEFIHVILQINIYCLSPSLAHKLREGWALVDCGSCSILSSENRIRGDRDQDLRGCRRAETGALPSAQLSSPQGRPREGDGPCCTCLEKRKPTERVEWCSPQRYVHVLIFRTCECDLI